MIRAAVEFPAGKSVVSLIVTLPRWRLSGTSAPADSAALTTLRAVEAAARGISLQFGGVR
jgi:hypothetical protein